jgi:two-component system, OmpR family, aerobic respiration control sensor histidine kinase ArcB
MDVGLGEGMDGIETTKQIRALNKPQLQQLPIIAVTGHANDPEKREEAKACGMQEVCSKPLQYSKLEALLDHFVYKQRQKSAVSRHDADSSKAQENSDIIDWDVCLQQTNGDEKQLRELLEIINIDLKMSQETLAKAYAVHDDETLRKELHRVRGGICYLSLPQLDNALCHFHEAVKARPQNKTHLKETYVVLNEAMHTFWNAYEKLH